MNLPTKQFTEYLESRSIIARVIEGMGVSCTATELCICIKLFFESAKCRIAESEANLLSNTIRALIFEHQSDFTEHRRTLPYFYGWGDREYELIVDDLSDLVRNETRMKALIKHRLAEERAELFDGQLYQTYLCEFDCEENPMTTFTFWIDFIEAKKGMDDYKRWFELKRKLTNLIRIGNAVFSRHEWGEVDVRMVR